MMTKNDRMFSNFMGKNKWYSMAAPQGGGAQLYAHQQMAPTRGYAQPVLPYVPITPVGAPNIPVGAPNTPVGATPNIGTGNVAVAVHQPALPYVKKTDCTKCDNGAAIGNQVTPPATCSSLGQGWVLADPNDTGSWINPCVQAPSVVYGCMNPTATNFNQNATNDDASCLFPQSNVVYGCTNVNANNFDPSATHDNGTCVYTSLDVYGCTQSGADNFNTNATIDDGSCTFAQIYGCTNENAGNYNEDATIDDGQCTYDTHYGCMDNRADNYDATATNDDGSCAFSLNPPAVGGGGGGGGGGGYGGGFPTPYGVGAGEVFPPIDSGLYPPVGGGGGAMPPPPAQKLDEDKNLLEKYWWLLVVAGVGYYMYNKNNNAKGKTKK